MLKLSKKTDYAIVLLTHLGGTSKPVSAQDAAEFFSLPYPMVANILKSLVNSGIIISSRGKKGGYLLSRQAEDISLYEIIEATDNPFNLVDCCKDECNCMVHRQCPTKNSLYGLHLRIKRFFEKTTLLTIIEEANLKTFLKETEYEIANIP